MTLPRDVQSADKKMQKMAGVRRVYLHGCIGQGCLKVWGPEDPEDVCDLCGGDRFDVNGKPKEFIIHFPLADQFQSLLACKQYEQAVRSEGLRETPNPAYMGGKYYLLFYYLLI